MANDIQLKRSSVAGKVPDSGNVLVGEPVVNLADKKIYSKNGSGDIIQIAAGNLSGLADVTVSSPTENDVLTWTGSSWESAAPTSNVITGVLTHESFVGDGTTSTFTLTRPPGNNQSVMVFVDSVLQEPSNNYTVSSTTLSFTSTPPNSANIDVRYFVGGNFETAFYLGTTYSDYYTGDGSNTTFNLSYTTSNTATLVFVDSVVQQAGINYYVDGMSITFYTAPSANADISVRYNVADRAVDFGNVIINANTSPQVGQALIWDGLAYAPANVSTDANVISVNGYTGVVTLDTDDISEGTNQYYTDAKVYSNAITAGFATEGYVNTAITNLVNGADSALDTLKELADALNGDNNFATTTLTLISNAYDQANTATILSETVFEQSNTKANVSDLTTANVSEVTNLYYTDARAFANVTSYLTTSANIDIGGNINASYIIANGGQLSNINADNISSGTLNTSRLATSGVSAATYGNATNIPVITVDTYGRVTSASNVTVVGGVSSVGGSTGDITNTQLVASVVESGILTTANVVEDINLYFSNARLAAALSSGSVIGNIIPVDNNISTLGTPTNRFKELYISGSTIYLGNLILQDDGSTVSILDEPDGNIIFTAQDTPGFTNSTITNFPGGRVNTDYGNGEEYVATAGDVTDAFGVPLGAVYDCMEPVGRTSTVDLRELI